MARQAAALGALTGLLRNLAAGARVATFLPVSRAAFRVDAAQLLLAACVSAAFDAFADWVRRPPFAAFDASAAGGELASLALLVAIAALAAAWFRDPPALVAVPVIVLVALPLVQIGNLAPWWLAQREATAGPVAATVGWLTLGWFVAVLARSAWVALDPGPRHLARTLVVAALLASPLVLPPGVLPDGPWFSSPDADDEMDPRNAASEAVLAMQRQLQDEALDQLAEHTQGETELYFIGFAPDGDGATWRPRLDKARSVMDMHWDTEGRSLVYVNDPETLTEAPMASVTFLREALDEIVSASDPDEDILMLYLAGRNHPDGSLRARLPRLGLVRLSPAGLAYLLRTAEIKWRIVALDVCTPAPFVDALADAHTLVLAGPGCHGDQPPTEVAEALFGEALAGGGSLSSAFDAAYRTLAKQGGAATLHVGEAIAGQIAKLKAAPGGRAALRPSTPG